MPLAAQGAQSPWRPRVAAFACRRLQASRALCVGRDLWYNPIGKAQDVRRARVYADTSVIGGCLDDEFADESRALLAAAREGQFILLLSDLLAAELERASPEIQEILADLPAESLEQVVSDEESARLRDAYLKARVVGARHAADAHHIALATVCRADLLVSWNFKHVVHWEKIRGFNAVNLREGYPAIEIRSPKEVV